MATVSAVTTRNAASSQTRRPNLPIVRANIAGLPRVTSSTLRCRALRRQANGRTPPCWAECARTADGLVPSTLAIKRLDSPPPPPHQLDLLLARERHTHLPINPPRVVR